MSMTEGIEISQNHEFVTPQRRIKTLADLSRWTNSCAYQEMLGFINSVNESVKSTTMSSESNLTPAIHGLTKLLETIESWIELYPPCEQPQRFGNKSFRDWCKHLNDNIDDNIKDILPDVYHGAVIELRVYLGESFGNSTRIDYGTGHEFNFLLFLCCFYKLRVLSPSDNLAVCNIVFNKYLNLVRRLQKTYCMEPAGSHGVWGLDDFQFVPFIWGSSQLIEHAKLLPSHIPNDDIAKEHGDEYLFFSCLKYIFEVKTGPFAEHSNSLWGISAVPHWTKVNQGLIKMFKVEVLSKFPIVQHISFGTLISFDPK